MANAPTTPVSWVFEPAASATGVRDELLLIGMPWKKPAARLASPETNHFLVGIDRRAQPRRIGAREHARVREGHQGHGHASHEHRYQVVEADQGQHELGQTAWQRAEHGHAEAACQVQCGNEDGRAHHGDQDSGKLWTPLENQNQRQRAGADRKRRDVRLSGGDRPANRQDLPARTFGINRKAEQLGNLTQEHRQRDAVHVAVADRLREQFGDETEPRQAGGHADDARDDRHHAGQRDRAFRAARRQRQHDGQDHGGE